MKRIYIPTSSTADWRRFLAEPERQWRKGFSARELAECWERSHGFPHEVQALFSNAANPDLHKLEMLLAIPEYKVDLPPEGGRPSQNDIFVLARTAGGDLVVIMVEGKVVEPFGPLLGDWLVDGSPGKQERLAFLCQTLGLEKDPPPGIRYQLLHRTASAILTAQRFNAHYAIMLVHSFSRDHAWLEDYQAFLGLYGVKGGAGELVKIPMHGHPELFTGWVTG
jgi:hypothetical protein